MEQVIEGAGVAFHNGWPAVNDVLYLFPLLRRHNRFVAALDDLPILTGDNVINVGADAFLVCPADKMCAFIKGISQDLSLIHILSFLWVWESLYSIMTT